MSNSLKALEINDLYSSLIGTLDEEKFFKTLCKEIKSLLKCDRISASVFTSDNDSILVYTSKKQSDLLRKKQMKSVEAQVLRNQRPYFSNSADRDPMFSHGETMSLTCPSSAPNLFKQFQSLF